MHLAPHDYMPCLAKAQQRVCIAIHLDIAKLIVLFVWCVQDTNVAVAF